MDDENFSTISELDISVFGTKRHDLRRVKRWQRRHASISGYVYSDRAVRAVKAMSAMSQDLEKSVCQRIVSCATSGCRE